MSFLVSMVVKETEDLGSRTAYQWCVYEKRDNMAPQATEQTGVDKKNGLGFYLEGYRFEFRKGNRLRCLKFLFKFLDPTEEISRYYLDCTTNNF